MKNIILMLSLFFLIACSDSESSIKNENVAVDSTTQLKMQSDDLKLFGDFSISIPDKLSKVSEERIKLKYPGKNRPQKVYATEDMGVSLNYRLSENKFNINELCQYLKDSKKSLVQSLGEDMVGDSFLDTINGIPFAIIEFSSPTPTEGNIYNLMLTTSLNGKMATLSFNCLESRYSEWDEELTEILASISIENKFSKDENE